MSKTHWYVVKKTVHHPSCHRVNSKDAMKTACFTLMITNKSLPRFLFHHNYAALTNIRNNSICVIKHEQLL